MGFLWAGLDESSDREQRAAFVVAGYLARQSDWIDIERHWMRRLENDGLRYFSSSECRFLKGEFGRFRNLSSYPVPEGRLAADAVREDLMLLMRSSKAVGFAVGVNLADYRIVRRSARARRVFRRNPYEQAYITAFIHIAATCDDEVHTPETVAFLCDQHDRSVNVQSVYDKLKEMNPRCGGWMGSLTYMDNKKSPAIQAGDLLASRSKDFLLEYLSAGATADREIIAKKWKPILGGNVGIKCLDEKSMMLCVNANLPKDGRPSLFSTQQTALFDDLT